MSAGKCVNPACSKTCRACDLVSATAEVKTADAGDAMLYGVVRTMSMLMRGASPLDGTHLCEDHLSFVTQFGASIGIRIQVGSHEPVNVPATKGVN